MLSTLKDLFDAIVPPTSGRPAPRDEHTLQLATAVLLVEVMRSDAEMPAPERAAVVNGLRDKFSLADDELERLVELAEHTARTATDFYAFTSRVNEAYDDGAKLRIVEHLWRVAYADGQLSAHENHVMRRIGDLLYVGRGDYVAAKQRARAELGLDPA